jgi:hypothetical protein
MVQGRLDPARYRHEIMPEHLLSSAQALVNSTHFSDKQPSTLADTGRCASSTARRGSRRWAAWDVSAVCGWRVGASGGLTWLHGGTRLWERRLLWSRQGLKSKQKSRKRSRGCCQRWKMLGRREYDDCADCTSRASLDMSIHALCHLKLHEKCEVQSKMHSQSAVRLLTVSKARIPRMMGGRSRSGKQSSKILYIHVCDIHGCSLCVFMYV